MAYRNEKDLGTIDGLPTGTAFEAVGSESSIRKASVSLTHSERNELEVLGRLYMEDERQSAFEQRCPCYKSTAADGHDCFMLPPPYDGTTNAQSDYAYKQLGLGDAENGVKAAVGVQHDDEGVDLCKYISALII